MEQVKQIFKFFFQLIQQYIYKEVFFFKLHLLLLKLKKLQELHLLLILIFNIPIDFLFHLTIIPFFYLFMFV